MVQMTINLSLPFISDLKILNLGLFRLRVLNFAYDGINKIALSYFHSFFELVDSAHQYSTQQASKNGIFLTQKKIPCNIVFCQYMGLVQE